MLKVSYKKLYGNEGTVYRQKIRIKNNNLILRFNNKVDRIIKGIEKKKVINSIDMKLLTFLKPLKSGINYINLTTLSELLALIIQDYDYNTVKRIKYNNTVVIVEA